jgi:hypothetical protein
VSSQRIIACSAFLSLLAVAGFAVRPANSQVSAADANSYVIGDERALKSHVDQALVNSGRMNLKQLFTRGQALFEAVFTAADGRGRPLQNGVFPPLPRGRRAGLDSFNRVSAPDADSCQGCHNKPRSGGGGDNVANVFVLGQRFSFFLDPTRPDENGLDAPGSVRGAANERNTLGMFGSGAIEMLAREMSADLIARREQAKQQAASTGQPVSVELVTKGVSFGRLTARPDGSVDTGGVEGVDPDLVIKPFHQKGVVLSLRQFTNNAYFHHHGMQPVERFGPNTDSDGDGVTDELSVGDITAATLFQAALGVPGQVIPRSPRIERAIFHGEELFARIGCGGCHRPSLPLKNRSYTEPNPFNPAFNLRVQDVPRPFAFDLTREGELPRIERASGGGAVVRAFTDLKRHDLGNHPMINNERVIQNGVPTNAFITKKLWGFASEPHFLHNGCATTITEAILAHGGEAQVSRDAFAALPPADRADVIEFLKSLQVLPANARALIVDWQGNPRADLLRRGAQ